MTTGIEKFKLDEKIHLYYLKHRGNVIAVAEELNIDLGYVKKIAKKIKVRSERDTNYFVANHIMEYILLGSEQRKFHYQQLLNQLENDVVSFISSCCKSTFDTTEGEDEDYYTCDKCGQTCKVVKKIQFGVVDKLKDTLEELRLEDEALIKAAEKLGYTNVDPAPVTKVTQHNIILSGKNSQNQVNIDPELIRKAEELSGTDREQVRRALTRKIIDSKDVTPDGKLKQH